MQTPAYLSPNGLFALDFRQSTLSTADFAALSDKLAAAHQGMQAIEAGEIKNPDEQRQVTHFTDRVSYGGSPTFNQVEAYFASLRSGATTGATGKTIDAVVINGIGGSALGPQLLQFAINGPYWNELSREARGGAARIYFTDNTDSAGIVDILAVADLERTLVVSISKSGGTRETANNLKAFADAYAAAGIDFTKHAAAVTMAGSKLYNKASAEGWSAIWEMAESIGGRTSETAVVGHVPAAAAAIDFGALLDGAVTMDGWTREADVANNPAYQLAAAWYLLGDGKGDRNMVIVPYADRLVLLARYLQQLVMESLGKEFDLDGNAVYQGLNVFGNKGGTDAHAFIQQLNDGRNDFFVTFIEILKDAKTLDMGDGLTMGNYLHNFQQGLANALAGKGRSVVNMVFEELTPTTIGMIIALYERAVAAYAEMINVNAFHQPGVEAYKKISNQINALTEAVQKAIADNPGMSGSAADFAKAADAADSVAEVAGILNKLAVNGAGVSRSLSNGDWSYNVQ
jgi:glucose-6-phosphate isomerase